MNRILRLVLRGVDLASLPFLALLIAAMIFVGFLISGAMLVRDIATFRVGSLTR